MPDRLDFIQSVVVVQTSEWQPRFGRPCATTKPSADNSMNVHAFIPAHNGGDQLLACLQSLLASTRQATGIIVIDDASTDGTVERAANHHRESVGD